MTNIIQKLREQTRLRKFRNNLTRGMKINIKISETEVIESSIISVSHLERKVVIHTTKHPYEAFEFSKVFPVNPIK